jgi:hypothetical protein
MTTDDIYHPDIEIQTTSNVSKCFGDIDTGTTYLKAKKECLEPTLLIFTRETINNPSRFTIIKWFDSLFFSSRKDATSLTQHLIVQ